MKLNVIKKTELKRMKWIEVGWDGFKWNGMEWVQVGWSGCKWDGMGSSGMEWM